MSLARRGVQLQQAHAERWPLNPGMGGEHNSQRSVCQERQLASLRRAAGSDLGNETNSQRAILVLGQ